MSEREWFLMPLGRFPMLDPAWAAEIKADWWRCFKEFWRWSYRITVMEAIDAYVKAGESGASE